MSALSGVRIAWLVTARKSPLVRLAGAAAVLAFCSVRSVSACGRIWARISASSVELARRTPMRKAVPPRAIARAEARAARGAPVGKSKMPESRSASTLPPTVSNVTKAQVAGENSWAARRCRIKARHMHHAAGLVEAVEERAFERERGALPGGPACGGPPRARTMRVLPRRYPAWAGRRPSVVTTTGPVRWGRYCACLAVLRTAGSWPAGSASKS